MSEIIPDNPDSYSALKKSVVGALRACWDRSGPPTILEFRDELSLVFPTKILGEFVSPLTERRYGLDSPFDEHGEAKKELAEWLESIDQHDMFPAWFWFIWWNFARSQLTIPEGLRETRRPHIQPNRETQEFLKKTIDLFFVDGRPFPDFRDHFSVLEFYPSEVPISPIAQITPVVERASLASKVFSAILLDQAVYHCIREQRLANPEDYIDFRCVFPLPKLRPRNFATPRDPRIVLKSVGLDLSHDAEFIIHEGTFLFEDIESWINSNLGPDVLDCVRTSIAGVIGDR